MPVAPRTPRLVLPEWRNADAASFAAMSAIDDFDFDFDRPRLPPRHPPRPHVLYRLRR